MAQPVKKRVSSMSKLDVLYNNGPRPSARPSLVNAVRNDHVNTNLRMYKLLHDMDKVQS